MKRETSLLLTLLLCSGCTLAPRYRRPGLPVQDAWSRNASEQAAASPMAPFSTQAHWREFFTDPGLQAVIAQALEHNRDLRVAALNVEKAQALYRIQRAELLPTAGVMGSVDKYRLPEKMDKDGHAKIVEQDSVNAGVLSWELDLFGRLRSLKKQALNQFFATEQARSATQLSLVAAVAQGYLALAADRENLQLARATLETQKASCDLIAQKREVGLSSDLDLRQAQSQVEAARGDAAKYAGLVALDQNALDLLVGLPVAPERQPKDLGTVGELKHLSAGLPSEVLLRRPDILMAEYQLQAANANIGAARAAFFPRVTLTGAMGFMAPGLAGLFGSGTRTWSFTPQLTAPLFAGGSLWANLRVAKADREIAVAQYEKAIQTAFREVNDALVLRESLSGQMEAQRSLVEALDAAFRLSEARYREGLDGYLGVLVAQRSLYDAQRGLVALRQASLANRITLYKALGGGV